MSVLVLQFLSWPTHEQLDQIQLMVRKAQSVEPVQDSYVSLPGRHLEKITLPCNLRILREEADPECLAIMDYAEHIIADQNDEPVDYFSCRV